MLPDPVLSSLERLISPSLAEKLERADREQLAIGKAIANYVAFPSSLGLTERSSIREDSVIQEVGDRLRATSGEIVVIDVCSGLSVVAKRIIEALGTEAKRVCYWGIDRDKDCIDTVSADASTFDELASFNPVLRDACDIEVCSANTVDLIVLNNALHEIPPRLFPKLFANFSRMLKPGTGRICVVDMVDLPAEAPESIAITWTSQEVIDILRAAGFRASATNHQKSVPVFRIVAEKLPGDLRATDMANQLMVCLRQKLSAAVSQYRAVRKGKLDGAGLISWVVAAGTVARIADEILALDRAAVIGHTNEANGNDNQRHAEAPAELEHKNTGSL